jgi:hypothetical protein
MKKCVLRLAVAAALLTVTASMANAQTSGMAVNSTGAPAAATAIMDVSSTTQGMLVPRMTQAQRNLIGSGSPATGLLIYQTDGTAGFYFYNGTTWTSLSGGGLSAGTTAGQIYVTGTAGAVPTTPVTTLPAAAFPALTADVTTTAGSLTTTIANNNNSGNHISTALNSASAGSTSGTVTGSGAVVLSSSPTLVTPSLGTPSALVGTNISGTAASLTAGKATILATARTINGVSFDGSANITVGGTPNYGTPVIVTATGTISGSAIVYVVNDGVTVTLPLASTPGQILVVLDGTTQSTGITIQRQGSNTITDAVQGLIGASSVTNTQFRLVSNGGGIWYNF